MKESQIQKKILEYLSKCKYVAYKIQVSNKVGCPDIIALSPKGTFVALEVKSRSGKLTELQKHNIKAINQNGGIAAKVSSVDDVGRIVILVKEKEQ